MGNAALYWWLIEKCNSDMVLETWDFFGWGGGGMEMQVYCCVDRLLGVFLHELSGGTSNAPHESWPCRLFQVVQSANNGGLP